jgi:hypothetical protein
VHGTRVRYCLVFGMFMPITLPYFSKHARNSCSKTHRQKKKGTSRKCANVRELVIATLHLRYPRQCRPPFFPIEREREIGITSFVTFGGKSRTQTLKPYGRHSDASTLACLVNVL